jgi:two-component system, LuxR family, response regulator TtrR
MTPVLNSKHVFIIEDNEAMLELIKFMVNQFGYTAHSYSSAYDFLKEISFLPLAVLITDLNMPGITGLQLQNVLIMLPLSTICVGLGNLNLMQKLLSASWAISFVR